MTWFIVVLIAALFLAYANGANDNFKGAATLFGSGTSDYRKALGWATLTTFAGSLTAAFLATKLIQNFSGKGLVPDALVGDPAFLTSVAVGAGLTVFVTARFGIPISTTHSLTGALAGSGLAAVGMELGFAKLGSAFFVPLLVSPLLAAFLAFGLIPAFHWLGRAAGIRKNTCVCVGEKLIPVEGLVMNTTGAVPLAVLRSLDIMIEERQACEARAVEVYSGRLLGIDVQKILDLLHFLSAGAVSFARGLNDTPKIVALSVTAGALGLHWNFGLAGLAIAIGGTFGARHIAETMSNRITAMNHGEGLTANLVTAFLVIFASRWGIPVSTTHVSCGSLFGLGLGNGRARWNVIGGIVSAWVLTLPVAAILSACFYWIFQQR